MDANVSSGANLPEEPPIWANKGEAVTCINGHVICEMARNVYVGEARAGEHFTNWSQPEPDKRTHVAEIRCTICRGAWVRGNPQEGYQFHFGSNKHGGWR
jgi:hypothetical protein